METKYLLNYYFLHYILVKIKLFFDEIAQNTEFLCHIVKNKALKTSIPEKI